MSIAYAIRDFYLSNYYDQILKILPSPHQKITGKTKKEICKIINSVNEKYVSGYLQNLKKQGKIRCYHGRWRKTLKGMF